MRTPANAYCIRLSDPAEIGALGGVARGSRSLAAPAAEVSAVANRPCSSWLWLNFPSPASSCPSPPSPNSARASSRVLIPAETRMFDRVVADPDEFEIRLAHAVLDHPVEDRLDPGLQRQQALLRRLQAHGLAGRAIDLADEGRGGDGEGVADDAGEPFVIGVLPRRLAVLDQLEIAGHELQHVPPVQVAGHLRVEIVLEIPDLLGPPYFGTVPKASGTVPAR